MTTPDHIEIELAREAIVALMREEYAAYTAGNIDPYGFGNAVAPLVSALAALSLMEKQNHERSEPGEASRSDD